MSKAIDVSNAANWNDDTAFENIAYLKARGRDEDVAAIEAARGLTKPDGPELGSPEWVPTATKDEVMAWVGEDPDKAQVAYDAENESDKPRKNLIEALEANFEFS